MRKQKHINFFCILLVLGFIYCQSAHSQTSVTVRDEFEKLSFKAEFNKNEYLPLEPIFLKLEMINKTGEPLKLSSTPSFKRIQVMVAHNGNSKTFDNLFLLSQPRNGVGTEFARDQILKGDVVLEKDLDSIFPETGQYKVQIILTNGRIGKDDLSEIRSKVIDIEVKEPQGIDKAAVNFLKKNQDRVLFWWKDQDKGRDLLEAFVQNYSGSVFGEYAIFHLGLSYKGAGEFIKARNEFEKIKSSENSLISKEAKQNLAEITGK